MKTGASWRCCWTCAHNGTDQPQLKRLDRGLLRLSSGLGLDKNAQKDRAQKDLGMPTQHRTHLCGSSACSRCDSGPCHCVNTVRGRFWSPLSREHGCRCHRGRGSTSCDRAPARAGRIWVLNRWHRLHGKKRRRLSTRTCGWRFWLMKRQPGCAVGTGSARLVAALRHCGHLRRGGDGRRPPIGGVELGGALGN